MIASAGILQVVDGKAEYEPNGAIVFAQVLNCVGFIWFATFLFGELVFLSANTFNLQKFDSHTEKNILAVPAKWKIANI
jgi:hypothetical protein